MTKVIKVPESHLEVISSHQQEFKPTALSQLKYAEPTELYLRDGDKTNAIRSRALYKVDKNWATFIGYAKESGTNSYRGGLTTLGVSYLF